MRHPPTLRITEAPRSQKRRLDESLSQDSEKERDLSVSFSESNTESSCASPVQTIEEIQELQDPSELLKHQLQQAEAGIARTKEQTRHQKENVEKLNN